MKLKLTEGNMADHCGTTLFCLPFAGGSSYSYREFQRYAGDSLRIAAIDLPGRGRRFCEPLLSNLHDMAEDVFGQIRGSLNDGAYGIYGHSMGAWIAYLLVKRIIREGYAPPRRLFVSGRQSPAVRGREKNWHLLPRPAFFDILKRFGGTSSEVIESRELMEIFEPVLRADFQALDAYAHQKSSPFEVPLTVMWAADDNVKRADALRWQEETEKEFSFVEFSGGHFFVLKHAPQVVDVFSRGMLSSRDIAACRACL